jgi:hypothetical protein
MSIFNVSHGGTLNWHHSDWHFSNVISVFANHGLSGNYIWEFISESLTIQQM